MKRLTLILCLLLVLSPCAWGAVNEVTPARNDYVQAGSTVAFPFTFKVDSATALEVLVNGGTVGGYAVTGLGASGGGTVTFTTAPAVGSKITILRKQPLAQSSVYQAGEAFPATRLGGDLDALAMSDQMLAERIRRSLYVAKGEALDMALPNVASRASKILAFDAAGLPIAAPPATVPPGGDQSLATVLSSGSSTARTLAERFAQRLNVKDFGAKGDGFTNDSVAIQATIDAATTAKTQVYLPKGTYVLTTALNCANRFGCQLVGELGGYGYGVTLLGNTGAGKPILDLSGSSGFLLENVFLSGGTSTIGIIMGYTNEPLGNQLGRMRRVAINFPNAKTANNNLGTVGVFNKSGENVNYEDLYIQANLPFILTRYDTTGWVRGTLASTFTPTSDFATLAAMSTGVNRFQGCMFVAYGKHRPAMAIAGANTVDLGNSYFGSIASGADDGTYSVTLQLDEVYNLSMMGGMFEGPKTAIEARIVENADILAITNDASATNGPAINLYGGGAGTPHIYGSRFNLNLNSVDRVLVALDSIAPMTGIINAEFLSESIVAGKTLPSAAMTPLLRSSRFASRVDELVISQNVSRGSYYKSLGAIPGGGTIGSTSIFSITPWSTTQRLAGAVVVQLNVFVESSVAGNVQTMSWRGTMDFTFTQTAAGAVTLSAVSAAYNTSVAQTDAGGVFHFGTATGTVAAGGGGVIVFSLETSYVGADKANYTMAAVADVEFRGYGRLDQQ